MLLKFFDVLIDPKYVAILSLLPPFSKFIRKSHQCTKYVMII